MITQKLYSSSSSKNSNKKEHNHEPHKQKNQWIKTKSTKKLILIISFYGKQNRKNIIMLRRVYLNEINCEAWMNDEEEWDEIKWGLGK
jgi:hypothetical protein